MEVKPTNELDEILERTDPEHIDRYYKENSRFLADEKKGFRYYIKTTLEEKNIKMKDVYSVAGVTESYGSKILRMEKHTSDRDMIIRLCAAGHFTLLEMNRALKLYGFSELYAKNPRDACLIVAINHRIYDIYEIDRILEEHGHKKLLLKNN